MKKSSHKGYCANRARANPAKGAKKTPVFEEGTGLCTPCVTKRDTGRTSQKCYWQRTLVQTAEAGAGEAGEA